MRRMIGWLSPTQLLAQGVDGYRKLSTGSSASSNHEDDDLELLDDDKALVAVCTMVVALLNVIRTILTPALPSFALRLGPGVEKTEFCSEQLLFVPRNDVLPIHAHKVFQDSNIVEQWIANGELSNHVDFSDHVRIDAVTTWVNGSDPRHIANRLIFAEKPTSVNNQLDSHNARLNKSAEANSQKDTQAKNIALQNIDSRYREFDELRYSVRSTRKSLSRNLGTHHIISTDFWKDNEPAKGTVDFVSDNRRGQVPSWLDQKSSLVAFGDRAKSKVPAIRMHHDWDIYVPFDATSNRDQWRAERLPTFSSLSAEGMIGVNMPGLAQTYILGSDDMFLNGNLTTADFFTPLFGIVMQFDMTSFYTGWRGAFRGHETTGFHYDATLLKRRFGTPGIPYPAHVNKPNVQPISVEARTIWRKEFDLATKRRFRGDGWTINTHSLTYAMQIERHREALLWSYFVAKADANGDGTLDEREMGAVLQELGASNITSDIAVKLPRRSSNKEAYRSKLLDKTNFPRPGGTKYSFSSFDGYPFVQPDRDYIRSTGLTFRQTPFSVDDEDVEANGLELRYGLRRFDATLCHVELLSCWPRDNRGSVEYDSVTVFKAFAFQNRKCGECLITHLVGKSGSKGLGAFLPPSKLPFPQHALDAAYVSTDRKETASVYHLPLTDWWGNSDFSLKAVAADNGLGKSSSLAWSLPSRRTFVAHLLTRYTYSLGSSTTKLEMLNRPKSVQARLRRLRQLVPRLSFFCINDDLEMRSEDGSSVKDSLQGFFESIWPTKLYRMPFEKAEFDFAQMEENTYPYTSV